MHLLEPSHSYRDAKANYAVQSRIAKQAPVLLIAVKNAVLQECKGDDVAGVQSQRYRQPDLCKCQHIQDTAYNLCLERAAMHRDRAGISVESPAKQHEALQNDIVSSQASNKHTEQAHELYLAACEVDRAEDNRKHRNVQRAGHKYAGDEHTGDLRDEEICFDRLMPALQECQCCMSL